jgi:hopanoid biosynthesis associated protein HpnK
MARLDVVRRLIVNADDYGRSANINAAVVRAHREGILTTASLMVNESGCAEAVTLARANRELGVGLHLSLCCGRAALPQNRIPGLVNDRGEFSNNPVIVGWRYFFHRHLRDQLRAEIRAQLERFQTTGLVLDHVNGHLHLHLHPVVFPMLMDEAGRFGIGCVRLTREPLGLNLRLARGRWLYRASHALIHSLLSRRAQPVLRTRLVRHTDRVFGLLQNRLVDENYVLKLLQRLPPGDSELYSHPSLDEFRNELDALVSPRVKALVSALGIRLLRYQDL